MRIEDLDTPRVKPGADRQAIEDLRWLGLDWDEGPYTQKADLSPYHTALDQLKRDGLVYPCTCTRREIDEAQSAPHRDGNESRYPGTCRHRMASDLTDQTIAWRVKVPDEAITFDDAFAGRYTLNVQQDVGDFVVATKVGLPAYQLAVVVDDVRQGVTQVVRGDDLLPSAARQVWLYHMLGWHDRIPTLTHLPLVVGRDGRRLAKRHGDTRLSSYRETDIPHERIVGLLASWSGIVNKPEPMSAHQFAQRFDLSRLSHQPVVFTEQDEQWLLRKP